ncbi:MAG: aldehyde dehydrogenase family protein [Caulobacterales bacterium]
MTTIPIRNPRSGEIDGALKPDGATTLDALAADVRARQTEWATLGIAERAIRLAAFADALAAGAGAVQTALEQDTGRRAIARTEIAGAVASLKGWAAQAPALMPSGWTPGRSNPTLRHKPTFAPYPLVGVISPWNFPLTLSMIDTVPALLAGCAVLLKPSEVTPRFAAPLRAIIRALGDKAPPLAIADGGGETGAGVVARVDAVCFTGSVATGRKVARQCAERMIPAFLELGGKDPLIVLESASVTDAVTAALRGSVLATGQACQSIERIYVAKAIFTGFVDALAQAATACRFNWPDIAKGEIGPIIFDKQAAILEAQLADAFAKGARALTGGKIERHGGGLWLAPTVLVDVTHDMLVMREETFGPIMPVMPFETTAAAVRLANDSIYGLSAAVFAGSIEEAEAIAVQLEAGAVSLNDAALTALFYEAEKHAFGLSGLGGSRMGAAGFHRFLRRRALIANDARPLPLSAFAEDA